MDRNDLLRWQEWLCWACGVDLGGAERSCCDHDHSSGLVRGWLCGACNFAEGRDEVPLDAPEVDWDEYRRNPPARQFGLLERYDGQPVEDRTWEHHDVLRAAHLLRRSRLGDRRSIGERTGLPPEKVDEIAEALRPLVERDEAEEVRAAAAAGAVLRVPRLEDG